MSCRVLIALYSSCGAYSSWCSISPWARQTKTPNRVTVLKEPQPSVSCLLRVQALLAGRAEEEGAGGVSERCPSVEINCCFCRRESAHPCAFNDTTVIKKAATATPYGRQRRTRFPLMARQEEAKARSKQRHRQQQQIRNDDQRTRSLTREARARHRQQIGTARERH